MNKNESPKKKSVAISLAGQTTIGVDVSLSGDLD